MSTQPTGYVCSERIYDPDSQQEYFRLWAPRCPMTQLPDEYRVTEDNNNPPLVHFAIPIDVDFILEYATRKNLMLRNTRRIPDIAKAMKRLSRHVRYKLELHWPFKATADCGMILVLYNNFNMYERMLVEEEEEEVIQMVQQALRLDESMRPKWYFDWEDPWRPDESDEDVGSETETETETEQVSVSESVYFVSMNIKFIRNEENA